MNLLFKQQKKNHISMMKETSFIEYNNKKRSYLPWYSNFDKMCFFQFFILQVLYLLYFKNLFFYQCRGECLIRYILGFIDQKQTSCVFNWKCRQLKKGIYTFIYVYDNFQGTAITSSLQVDEVKHIVCILACGDMGAFLFTYK